MTNLLKRHGLLLCVGVLSVLAGFLLWKQSPKKDRDQDNEEVQLEAASNSIGMKFVKIPAGTFQMGSPQDEEDRDNDELQHEVEITRPFWLGVYEVTQEQYEKVMGVNPSMFTKAIIKDGDQHPVENVSWDEAIEFCRRLSESPEERKSGRSYRLPTEAEWEYACRAGKLDRSFAFGNDLRPSQANTAESHKRTRGRTTVVGSYKPNVWGLYDMHGNVWEWCNDWYEPNYYKKSPRKDPQGPESGERRVIRGGSRGDQPANCRSANRAALPPGIRLGNGFRVVLVEEGK